MTIPAQNATAYEVAPPNAVEPKTLAATGGSVAGTIVSGFALYLIGVLIYHDGGVPLPVSLFVGLVVTTGLTFVGGFYARHVNRSTPPTKAPAPAPAAPAPAAPAPVADPVADVPVQQPAPVEPPAPVDSPATPVV